MDRDPFHIDVHHQRKMAYRLVLVAGFIFVMSLMGKQSRERREAAAAEAAVPQLVAPEVVAPPVPGVRERPPDTYQPGARTKVPRPALPTRTSRGPEGGAADDEVLRAALSASLQAVVPDVRDCLHQWWMINPDLAGAVELEFVVDEQGLGEVEVLDHSQVPMGPLSCFATALYDAEWPRVEGSVTVVQPFRFEN